MRRQTQRRVIKIKHGYNEKKRSVWVPRQTDALRHVVDRRVEIGYRKGVSTAKVKSKSKESFLYKKKKSKVDKKKGVWVELGYTIKGTPRIQERKRISQPSRPMLVTHGQRWGRGRGDSGTYRRETTEGRKTGEEARQKELGGQRRLWVR